MTSGGSTRKSTVLVTILAFLAVYLVWGSTYLVIRIGVRDFSPSGLLGLRFLIAGVVNMGIWGLFHRRQRATLGEMKTAAVAGVIMLVGGTGLLAYAEKTVNSSTAALIVAAAPFWFALGDYILGGKALRPRQIAGIAIGFAGVWILVWPSFGSQRGESTVWTLLLMLATVAWVSAGLYSKRRPMPKSIFLGAGVEMIAAGAFLMGLGAILGEYTPASFLQAPSHTWAAVLYLALFGSCVAFTAYAWLLEHQPTHRVASYAYVNPVVAVLLGALFDGDPFSISIVLALALITLGVTLTMSRR
ncbi:MAG: EamA family transporter [Acidobacteria bacterium]|nr:EamA family transporter [Acidobacteriota bacterium]